MNRASRIGEEGFVERCVGMSAVLDRTQEPAGVEVATVE